MAKNYNLSYHTKKWDQENRWSNLIKQQWMGGFERVPVEIMRQSCIVNKARLTKCCLLIRDQNSMGFNCLLWLPSNEHMINLLSMTATRCKYHFWAEDHTVPCGRMTAFVMRNWLYFFCEVKWFSRKNDVTKSDFFKWGLSCYRLKWIRHMAYYK